MSNPKTLAVGHYSKADQNLNESQLDSLALADYDALGSLSDEERHAVKAIAIHSHSPCNGAVMDQLPSLGLLANYGVGYDAIDVAAATERNIKVTNTPGVLNDDVADLTVTMLFAHARQIIPASNWVREGDWAGKGTFPLARKISGGRVGIVGLGRIGREIADRLSAFKMDIHYLSRTEKETPGWTFHEDPVSLAAAVDYLVVALVGGSDTENYISADVIKALGPNGILVNISRGSTVDEGALLDALESKAIAGACLDVYRSEPNIDPRFIALDNVLLQPHHGSGTHTTRQAMGQLQRDNVIAFMAGKPLLSPVN